MQTKKHSLIESLVHTATGLVIGVLGQMFIFPVFGVQVTLTENFLIASFFTVLGVLKGYLIRRWFTKRTERVG